MLKQPPHKVASKRLPREVFVRYLKPVFCLGCCLAMGVFAQGVGGGVSPGSNTPGSATPGSATPGSNPPGSNTSTSNTSTSNTPASDSGPGSTPSPPVPPRDEIRRSLDYYFNGKNSPPALVDFIPCLKVDIQKSSETYSQCLEIAKNSVPLYTRINLWTMWYLPQGSEYEGVILQVFWGEQLRLTEDYRLKTSGRFRTWRTVNLNRKGTWTFKIVQGSQEMDSLKLSVE